MTTPRTNTNLGALADIMRTHDKFVVLSHYRPDGDAIGSTLAVGLALQAMGKQVRMLNEDPVPATLAFLPGSEKIELPGDPVDAEVVIAVDCANRERLGAKCLEAVAGADRVWINIDHHRSNEGYGDFHYIDFVSPATGQILYDFLTSQDLPVTREIGDNLYVAISTDTGSFQYESVTARTYEIGAELIKLGVNVSALARETYENFPLRRIQLLRGLLNVMKLSPDGRIASWALTQKLAQDVGIEPEDSEGLIDTLRSVQGVIVAVYFEEMADGKIRMSLRSKDNRVDVGKIAALFGGGGHALAAGVRMRGPLEEAEQKIFAAIDEAIQTLPPQEFVDGVLLVDKGQDMTSHDVVAVARKSLNERKIGHCGTLDPMATGLLILVVGRATKIQDLLMAEEKEYEGIIRLGSTTSTQDRQGEVLEEKPVPELTREQIVAAFDHFKGDFLQMPPMVSAIKKDGVPLYKLAREGKTIERDPRLVTVFHYEIQEINLPEIKFRVVCSKGFYVRTYANDIGALLGCGAHLQELRRTRSGKFTVEGNIDFPTLKNATREEVMSRMLTLRDVSKLRGA